MLSLCGLHKVCSHIMPRSDLLCCLHNVCNHIMARSDLLCCLHKVCNHIMARSDLLCCLHNVCNHIMARSDLLCCLHKVCSHIMARSDLYVDLSTRVERLSRGQISHTCTHCGPIFKETLAVSVTLTQPVVPGSHTRFPSLA